MSIILFVSDCRSSRSFSVERVSFNSPSFDVKFNHSFDPRRLLYLDTERAFEYTIQRELGIRNTKHPGLCGFR